MKTKKHELPVPAGATANPEAVEFLRAWEVGEAMHVSLRHNAWRLPAAWEIVLADILQHFADACEKSRGRPCQAIIKQVSTMFQKELKNPTNKPSGDFV